MERHCRTFAMLDESQELLRELSEGLHITVYYCGI